MAKTQLAFGSLAGVVTHLFCLLNVFIAAYEHSLFDIWIIIVY